MSLRRRITGAVALAVAAVAVTLGITGYLSTRSHLIGEVQHQLRSRVSPFLQPHASGRGAPSIGSGRSLPAEGRGVPPLRRSAVRRGTSSSSTRMAAS